MRQEFDTRLQSFFDPETWQRTKLHHAMTVTFPTLLGYVESLSRSHGLASAAIRRWWPNCVLCLIATSGVEF